MIYIVFSVCIKLNGVILGKWSTGIIYREYIDNLANKESILD